MTPLTIVPNYEKKRLKLVGTVAAGEHVAVTVVGGGDWTQGGTLRLRALLGGKTIAVFPYYTEEREVDGQTVEADAWGGTEDATCELNLNTIQAEKMLHFGGECLWVLDDPANHTLYGTGEFYVNAWPKHRPVDVPYDLDNYPDLVKELSGNVAELSEQLANKVDKVAGKGLSENDYTNAEKAKLAGVAEGANAYVLSPATAFTLGGVKQGTGCEIAADGTLNVTGGGTADSVAWDDVTGKPTFANVATSGSYNDLTGKPAIPAAVTIDATLATQGAAADAKAVGNVLALKREKSDLTVTGIYAPFSCGLHDEYLFFDGVYSVENECLFWGDPDRLFVRYDTNGYWTVVDVENGIDDRIPGSYDQLELASTTDPSLTFVRPFTSVLHDTIALQGHVDAALALKADKSEMSVTPGTGADADKATIQLKSGTSATVLTAHQSLAGLVREADLPYRLVEPGEWEFSGGSYGQGYYIIISSDGQGGYNYDLYLAEDDTFITEENKPTDGVLSVFFEAADMTATRASLPGYLLDRAVNAVPVSTDTTLTLPALVNAGGARDFLVKVTTSADDLNITWQGQGSEAPNGADELQFVTEDGDFPVVGTAGGYLFSFTEVEAHTFAVSMKPLVIAPQAQGGS